MQLTLHNKIGIGDAENDHAFLELCECSAAVGTALPAVKDRCDLVMASANGRGVAELISMLLAGNFFPEHSIARPSRLLRNPPSPVRHRVRVTPSQVVHR